MKIRAAGAVISLMICGVLGGRAYSQATDDTPVKVRGGSLKIHGVNGWTQVAPGNPNLWQYQFTYPFMNTATVTLDEVNPVGTAASPEAAEYNWQIKLSFRMDDGKTSDSTKQLFICTNVANGVCVLDGAAPGNVLYALGGLDNKINPVGGFRSETLDSTALLYNILTCKTQPYGELTTCNHISTVEFLMTKPDATKVDDTFNCPDGECKITIKHQ